EDGIRDVHVTGVQTCALPISLVLLVAALGAAGLTLTQSVQTVAGMAVRTFTNLSYAEITERSAPSQLAVIHQTAGPVLIPIMLELGRAACRDRGQLTVGGSAV